MRKFLWFRDKDHPHQGAELSPFTFEEFEKIGQWSNANDMAFDQFLRHNDFFMLDRFAEDVLQQAVIRFAPGEPIIDWTVLYGDHYAPEAIPPCKCMRVGYVTLPESVRYETDLLPDVGLGV